MFDDGAGKGFDLGEANGLPAEGLPSDRRGFHARADGEETHRLELGVINHLDDVGAVREGEDEQRQGGDGEEDEDEAGHWCGWVGDYLESVA